MNSRASTTRPGRSRASVNRVLWAGTLAFLVLLTGRLESTGGTPLTVDPFAQSAINTTVGDLQKEITVGSTVTSPGGTTLYTPKPNGTGASSTAVPALAGFTPAISSGYETDGLANLLKRSANGVPFYSKAANLNYTSNGVSRAAAVNSTSASLDGHAITSVRWNEHLLLGRANTNSPTDYTPVASFTSPDWILVSQNGSNPTTWSSALTSSSSNPVVGRYAYAIYNEGGLLDMNVAGYPSGSTTSQTSYKSPEAFTDLTQLGLTQTQVDQIVGWRNYATAQPSGAFPNYTFNPAAATRYYNAVLANQTGFLTPSGGTFNGMSDQLFTSRQQLLSLTQSLNISPDLLQYLGTFTRGLEQPLVSPDPNRPLVLTTGGAPPASTSADSYTGNNDAEGGDNSVNPSFLNVRVSSTFTRLNGVTAVVGEPLVKTKFALSRLALVAYNATNASVQATSATASDPDPIYDRFGLQRTSTSSPWTYNHGSNAILTLNQVAALSPAREPDFAELLKASLTVGSLAKAGPNLNANEYNYQYSVDKMVDYQVLQIMANLIDQQDADSYPTVIQIYNNSSGSYYTFYGVEDLPYFYRYHLMSVVDQLPNPVLSNSATTTFPPSPQGTTRTGSITTARDYTNPSATPTSASWSINNPYVASINAIQKGALFNPGEATFFYVPDLWNPHDPNTVIANSTNRPALFRIYAVTDDPIGVTSAWRIGAETQFTGSSNVSPTGSPPLVGQSSLTTIIPETYAQYYYWPISVPMSYTGPTATTTLTFSDNGGTLFREPTLLWNRNPTGIALSGPSIVEANTGKTYYGIIAGKAPVSMQVTITSTPVQPTTDGSYIVQGNSIAPLQYLPVASYPQITFFLQYQDPNNSSNWITYDVKYPDLHGYQASNLVVNTSDYTGTYMNPLADGQFAWTGTTFDPRTARWGVGTGSTLGQISAGPAGNGTSNTAYLLEPNANADFNNNILLATTNFSVFETDRSRADKCNEVFYSNPGATSSPGKNLQMRLFSGVGFSASNGQSGSPLEFDGLLSQNNPALLFNSRNNSAANQQLYFEDADGVARRAMGAYASTTMTDASTSSQAQSISTTPNRIGLPLATASTFNNNAVATPTQQSQSRPIVLNRAFRSVSEMSYTFTGTPWKNIDFFTPESGDSALLDTFSVSEPPTNGLVAGKVDLNTRQAAVIQALVAGASRDEWYNSSAPPAYALPPVNSTEAANVAATLVSITSDKTHAWRGPLTTVSGLVGRYVATPTGTTDTDFITYVPPSPVSGQTTSASYAGLSAALDCASLNGVANHVYSTTTNEANVVSPIIQRFRESGLRPLADCGQTRVWNLLIDVIAQTGSYPATSTGLSQFSVTGERHYWQHVAIDRYTGQILDQSIEEVAEVPDDIVASNLTTTANATAGTTIGTLSALPGGSFTFSLVSGTGGADNGDFTISGNSLQTATNLNPAQTTYSILVQATGSNGQTYQQVFTVTTSGQLSTDTPTMPFWALAFLALLLFTVGSGSWRELACFERSAPGR